MKQFLEVESAHYPELEVLIASEGQSRVDLMNQGKKVDTIHIYRWNIQQVRILLEQLGLKRDESVTWDKKKAEAKLKEAFTNPRKAAAKEDL